MLFFTFTRDDNKAVERLLLHTLLADVRTVFTTCSSSFEILVVVSSAAEALSGRVPSDQLWYISSLHKSQKVELRWLDAISVLQLMVTSLGAGHPWRRLLSGPH